MYNTRLRKKQKIGNEWMDLMHGDKDIDPFTIAMREMLGERTINYIDFIITFRIYLDEDSINIPLEYHHANINPIILRTHIIISLGFLGRCIGFHQEAQLRMDVLSTIILDIRNQDL